ncbi:MAG: hypothetical protein ACR2LE_02570 [Nocardioidaceae bacterium]
MLAIRTVPASKSTSDQTTASASPIRTPGRQHEEHEVGKIAASCLLVGLKLAEQLDALLPGQRPRLAPGAGLDPLDLTDRVVGDRAVPDGQAHHLGNNDNFCGVPGLVVDGSFTVDGSFLARLQGRDSVFYGMDHTRVVIVYTRRATGQTATDIQPRTTSKDLKITNNGDGTLTIVQLLTGGERTYGDEGKLIAKNSGQVRFRIVVDYNGTLSNPDDDTELSSELVFGSTGTNDDFCSATLADWGVTT